MADINYSITDEIGNPLLEGFTWTGTIYGVNLGQTPTNSIPTSITSTVGDLTITFTPDAINGYKVYPSITDSNHYITFRSQNIATQYPNSGYSLDIWSATMYSDISNPSSPATWQLLTENDPYNLNNFKYTLLYDYTPGSPSAAMWIRGGKINFTIA
jgi:hypothetical protein